MGFMSSDHFHPGSSTSRATSKSPTVAVFITPWSNVLVSSAEVSRFFFCKPSAIRHPPSRPAQTRRVIPFHSKHNWSHLERLGASPRADDLVARYGGDEFVMLLGGNVQDAIKVAERVCEKVEFECVPQQEASLGGSLTVSVGVTS